MLSRHASAGHALTLYRLFGDRHSLILRCLHQRQQRHVIKFPSGFRVYFASRLRDEH